uniref:CCHC-type domain-containing protein n=1 Tax=Aegilops tauschii subsp. strangulata TaxID=200361 RepID=A0A453A991_AEGTS
MSYAPMISYSCGDPGHHVHKCESAKSCFICKMITHKVDSCPVRKKAHTCARYVGSAAPGLGFYHLDTPGDNAQHQGHCLG